MHYAKTNHVISQMRTISNDVTWKSKDMSLFDFINKYNLCQIMYKFRNFRCKNLPKAHTACSQTFWCGEAKRLRNSGTALASTTACVCCDVPEAMFVRAHAASNWREGLSEAFKHPTRTGKMPELIKASMGGFRSDDRSFRAAWTAASWVAGSELFAFSTIVSRLAVERLSLISSSSENQNKHNIEAINKLNLEKCSKVNIIW